ncbi:MAG: FIST C-terminal domain-containing protein [Phycisphaeraceae bacterium]|nr:FIST C-terminal domain-containing protein [Phycisphaeraceae bacterium]
MNSTASALKSTAIIQHSSERGWSGTFPQLDSERTMIIVFGASEYKDKSEALHELHKAFPRSRIIGCSTSGEIFGTRVMDGTLSVAIKRFDATTVTTAIAPVRNADDSYRAGATLGEQLLRRGLRGVMVLSDGLNVNGTELVHGLNSVLPEGTVLTGGLAGDGDRFKETWVLRNGLPESRIVSAMGFYGDQVEIGHGSKGGWSPFGPERMITRSQGNVLFELDGTPALALYKKYLGDRSRELPASGLLFPLAVRPSRGGSPMLVRTILAVSETDQSLTFAGDIPEGWSAQLMRANFDWLVDASAESAKASCALDSPICEPLTIAVSCVGRRLILGERTEDELRAAEEALSSAGRMIGMYSYGELSPHINGGRCELHNQTMTITTIGERCIDS